LQGDKREREREEEYSASSTPSRGEIERRAGVPTVDHD
jgi:hypothetical protein